MIEGMSDADLDTIARVMRAVSERLAAKQGEAQDAAADEEESATPALP